MYYRKYIYAGDVLEIEEHESIRPLGKHTPRGANVNLTPAQQREANDREARKNLSRRINANFTTRDIFLTLTYRRRPRKGEEENELRKFLRRVRDWRKLNELPALKYIAVTETGETGENTHHHIVMSGMSLDKVKELWPNGRIMVSNLDGGDYTGLAHYITKEPAAPHKKRWSQSRNLAKPTVVTKVVKRSREVLAAPKGYRQILYELYASAVTGACKYMRCIRIGGVDLGGTDDQESGTGGDEVDDGGISPDERRAGPAPAAPRRAKPKRWPLV